MGLVRSFALVIVFLSCLIAVYGQGTRIGFYSTTCPNAETIVRTTVASHFGSDPKVAPGLLRMHNHDCFVQGCDGSVLLSGPNSERTAGANVNLHGFEVIDDAKRQLEAACPGVVSCADILALAARDSVSLTNGQSWQVPTGRRDGRVSLASNVNNLPSPSDSLAIQQRKFSAFRLNTRDLVTLVGMRTHDRNSCMWVYHEQDIQLERKHSRSNNGPNICTTTSKTLSPKRRRISTC
ncbi:Peroxidase superfamily protein [Arabidopsis thaliana]|uniref:peroxidase n=1 Tax=Arabidopsis thaliana TaxID=3702 RepID=F4KEH2_ARATH|nr:Peroxidase superfamily protein [Arabidopsis thaliana]AED94450.1 Peroxidase superfamily protein [Arabidopsis thaliana]|eukprot:NP_001031985.1 Peroxidase superfamily protein [Arabidopsis thaliana]